MRKGTDYLICINWSFLPESDKYLEQKMDIVSLISSTLSIISSKMESLQEHMIGDRSCLQSRVIELHLKLHVKKVEFFTNQFIDNMYVRL